MKTLLTLLSLLIITPAQAAAPAKEVLENDVPAEIVKELSPDIVVKVDGMVCDFCAQSLKKVFSKQDSVENIGVDLDKGEVIVDLKEGKTLSDEEIEKVITFSGYDTKKITRK